MYEFILASISPRRQKLFGLVQTPFLVKPADVDETQKAGESPEEYVLRLAQTKARDVGQDIAEVPSREMLIIAADTTVAHQGEILGKPANPDEARDMLLQLQDQQHHVYSGLVVYHPAEDRMLSEVVETQVTLRAFDEEELEAYIDSGDPFDKAGAYAIQNDEFQPVRSYEGCYANVMGLPLCQLEKMLQSIGVSLSGNVPVQCQEQYNFSCPIPEKLLHREQF